MQYDDPFHLFEERRLRRDKERLELRKRLAELDQEASEDAIAVKVLRNVYEKSASTKSVGPNSGVLVPTGNSAVNIGDVYKDMPVKEVLLSILRESAPEGMTAAQIRQKAMLKYRRDINSNTLTVSLVRASKIKGDQPALVRCEGRKWRYILESQEPGGRISERPPNRGVRFYG